MSALNTLLAIDGRAEVLSYLAELGLQLPAGFRSTHPGYSQVAKTIARMPGWRLEPAEKQGKRLWCDVYQRDACVTTLMFESPPGRAEPVLAGTRGDLGMPLLGELARELGPLVVLLDAEKPLLVEAPT